MKSLRNKIILSGLVLLFALVATIGSTFAWFTVSNTVSVASMELDVKSSESLLIKIYENEVGTESDLLNANNYKANLSYNDIVDPEGDTAGVHAATELYWNLAAYQMTDVTATASLASVALTPKTLRTYDVDLRTWGGSDSTSNSTTGNFVELKFWLLSQGVGTEDFVLEDLRIETIADNSDTQDNIVNAVTLATWVSQTTNTSVDGTPRVYSEDPDYDFKFIAGMRGYDSDTPANNYLASPAALVLTHAEFHETDYEEDGSEDVVSVAVGDIADAEVIYTLSQNVPTLVTVRIYIEGWDADTTNSVLAASFTISFKFSLQDTI